MGQLGRTVPAFTFSILVAASPAHAQGAPARWPAWVKVCENVTATSKNADGSEEEKAFRICMTYHERINGNGIVIVGAALREIDGQDKKHFLIAMPPDTQVGPAMRAHVFPRDVWEALKTKGKLEYEETGVKELKFGRTSCYAKACTAEIEATPALISDLEAAGGLVVFAVNHSGMTVARPIPLIDFAQAVADPPFVGNAFDDVPVACAGAEWRGCIMKPIREWKR
jgi:hypothetical protein